MKEEEAEEDMAAAKRTSEHMKGSAEQERGE